MMRRGILLAIPFFSLALLAAQISESTFRDVRAIYSPNSKVLIRTTSEVTWNIAKEKRGRYTAKGRLSGKYAGQEATVLTVQIEENSIRPAHRLGPSDDDIIEPYFSLVVKFDDGTIAMTTNYLISIKAEVIPAQDINAYQEALRAATSLFTTNTFYASAKSQLYYTDLSIADALSIASNFATPVDRIRDVPLLQPLTVTNVEYVKQVGALIVSLKLPDNRNTIAVVSCNWGVGSCFDIEAGGSYLLKKVPSDLTPKEIAAVRMRTLFEGMSRSALYLSLGWPDKENDYGRGGTQLVYFGGRTIIYLDQNDKISDVQHFER